MAGAACQEMLQTRASVRKVNLHFRKVLSIGNRELQQSEEPGQVQYPIGNRRHCACAEAYKLVVCMPRRTGYLTMTIPRLQYLIMKVSRGPRPTSLFFRPSVCLPEYVCMYACMYLCMHARMYVRTYVRIYVRMYVCRYACMCAYMHAFMYVQSWTLQIKVGMSNYCKASCP